MEFLINHIEVLGAFSGACLALWGLFAKIDKTYRMHLNESFASKKDFLRLENKVDKMLFSMSREKRRERYSRD